MKQKLFKGQFLLLSLFSFIFFFSCQKQRIEPVETQSDELKQQATNVRDLPGFNDFLSIPELNHLKNRIVTTEIKYFSDSETNQLWIFTLKQGTYGLAKSKVAASLKNGQFSMIIVSYNYDEALYIKGDLTTYTGIMSVYDQQLKNIRNFTYDKGKLTKIEFPDCPTCSMPGPEPANNTDWCLVWPPLCNYQGGPMGDDANAYLTMAPDAGGGGGHGGGNDYDPNDPFANLESPIDAPDEPLIDNGIEVVDIPQGAPTGGTPRRIGKTTPRGNTEDLQHGTNADVTGILPFECARNNDGLFEGMDGLFWWCTFFDNQLKNVGQLMINKFKTNTSNNNVFENPILNQKVLESNATTNFLKDFGNILQNELRSNGGNINNVLEIDMGSTRPKFNGRYNKFHGLQVLINDTEYTEIQLDKFEVTPTGMWEAEVTVTIIDHFGLDKHDALQFQTKHEGFADWWLLQHDRGFVPFKTKVAIRKRIIGVL